MTDERFKAHRERAAAMVKDLADTISGLTAQAVTTERMFSHPGQWEDVAAVADAIASVARAAKHVEYT